MIALLANTNACSRLRSSPDILLSRRHIVDGHSFRKQTSHFIRLDGWNNHARTTRLPISRCRHFLLSSQMQGIDDTQKFIKVATGGCWVQDGQLQFPVNKIIKEFERILLIKTYLSGPITKTARQVNGKPLESISSGSIMP